MSALLFEVPIQCISSIAGKVAFIGTVPRQCKVSFETYCVSPSMSALPNCSSPVFLLVRAPSLRVAPPYFS